MFTFGIWWAIWESRTEDVDRMYNRTGRTLITYCQWSARSSGFVRGVSLISRYTPIYHFQNMNWWMSVGEIKSVWPNITIQIVVYLIYYNSENVFFFVCLFFIRNINSYGSTDRHHIFYAHFLFSRAGLSYILKKIQYRKGSNR